MIRFVSARAVLACVILVAAACAPAEDTPLDASNEGDGGSNDPGGGDAGPSSDPDRCAAPPCAEGDRCKDDVDCASGVCRERICMPASAGDGTQNAGETDVDCGGPPAGAPRCSDGKKCLAGSDCQSVSCSGGVCQPPTSGDGIKNGTETDIDCGGGAPTNARRCETGELCVETGDCDKVECAGGICQPPTKSDGIKNGTETDIDCGGGAPTNAARCASGKSCVETSDCDKVRCTDGLCQPATNGDGIQNGTESDVDCGGGAPTNAARCELDKTCDAHGDCASGACATGGPKAGLCVPFKSCVTTGGGLSTCGRDDRERGGNTVAHESCCDVAPIAGGTVKLNRFAITAGRMRAFIERTGGNVRGYVQAAATKPAGWQSAWDVLVPSSVAEAEIMLGAYWNGAPNDPNQTAESPHSKRSCGNANYNGHTYWVSSETGQVYTRAELDPKVLNCVGWHLVNAFCAWDGGRMPTAAELRNAFTNGNTTTWPWGYAGSAYNGAYSSTAQDVRLNHRYNYGYPGGTPATNRITWWLSPPGRFWQGWNANKIEIAGNVLEWTGDQPYNFAWNMSFENHEGTMNSGGDWRTPNDRSDVPNGYYALGARCAYP
ncbi:MAG: hypothetical protein KF764_04630 [Labilithrix sp.]|nr:hypothetical protein [Labilithrix sp.]